MHYLICIKANQRLIFTNSIVDWFYLCMNEQLFDIIENINDFESYNISIKFFNYNRATKI
ncbi:TPA: hypothetical protein SLR16_001655 [Staphylococcus aureus]|nr:hypothetical protein [Staphylococcus aureus]HDZ7744928.1 hypothetical protein [Staphylococcus aureus]HDZ7873079.1 hypothetical protein [Staphylococcus aureus]HEI5258227.1 hypothetical protein [Staphylococcus aureus]HEI5626073.1 hypothetical protein [Staphylococcus aureus]